MNLLWVSIENTENKHKRGRAGMAHLKTVKSQPTSSGLWVRLPLIMVLPEKTNLWIRLTFPRLRNFFNYGLIQCDRMAKSFVHFRIMKICLIVFFFKSGFKSLQNTRLPPKALHRLLCFAKVAKFSKIWSHCMQLTFWLSTYLLFLSVLFLFSPSLVFRFFNIIKPYLSLLDSF